MKTNSYLLPTYFKAIGWFMFVVGALTLSIYLFRGRVLDLLEGSSITTASTVRGLLIGLLFIAFSREKIEDEYITKVRSDSLIWAVIVNTAILIVLSLFVFGGLWSSYISFLNLYTVLVLFIIKFNFALSHLKKQSGNEE